MATTLITEKLEYFTTRLKLSTRKRLNEYKKRTGITICYFIENAIIEKLDKEEKKISRENLNKE